MLSLDTDRIVDALFEFLESLNETEEPCANGESASSKVSDKSVMEDESVSSGSESEKTNEEKEETDKEAEPSLVALFLSFKF